jgi:hypothetical protein
MKKGEAPMRTVRLIVLLLILPAFLACGGTSGGPTDGSAEDASDGRDADPDGASDDGLGDTPIDGPGSAPAVTLPAGGGIGRSANYEMTLSIGTPQPMGKGSSAGHEMTLGPAVVHTR